MAKVLKITKPDGTLHITPIVNRAFYETYNKRLKANEKWRIEEIDAEAAKNLPYRDDNFIRPADTTKALADKDSEIEKLKAQLKALQNQEEIVEEEGEPVLTRADKQRIARHAKKAQAQ